MHVRSLVSQIESGQAAPVRFNLADTASKPKLRQLRPGRRKGRDGWTACYDLTDASLRLYVEGCYHEANDLLTLQGRLEATARLECPVRDVRILDVTVPVGAQGETTHLDGITGGFVDWKSGMAYPPQGLRLWREDLNGGESTEVDSGDCGKSSAQQIPIWLYHQADGGLWMGPEFSGCWHLDVDRVEEGTRLRISLPQLDFIMLQGEVIDLPAVSIGGYDGDVDAGRNRMRRILRDTFLRRINGKAPEPTLVFQGIGGQEPYHHESGLRPEVDAAAEVGLERFVLNAGWYQSHKHRSVHAGPDAPEPEGRLQTWYETLGDWEPHPEKFPSGIGAFRDYVESKGLQMGLWLDARITPHSQNYETWHDALIPFDPEMLKPGMPFGNEGSQRFWLSGQVDLTRDEGKRYLRDLMDRFCDEYGAKWFWLDFNAYPRHQYWNGYEQPDRRGLTELRYWMGLYEVLDDVLDRHGDVWLESCANGGMIIDLGMLRRSHSTWINDFVAFEVLGQPFDLDIIRSYRGGACSMLPAVCPQSLLGLPTEVRESDEPLSPFHYISHFAGTITFGQAMCKWKQSDRDTARACMDLFKRIRPLLTEDFYLLLCQAQAKDVWDAWQFHTASGEGVVIAFRMEDCPDAEQTLELKGIEPGTSVQAEILHGAESVDVDGTTMTIRLPEPKTAAVVQYRS